MLRLLGTQPVFSSDEVPSDEHQDAVAAVAGECLAALTNSADPRWSAIVKLLEGHPIAGLEVMDEAFVVHKNRNNLWGNQRGQADDPVCVTLAKAFNEYGYQVHKLRGGRPRPSTTPTLKGGARRPSAAADNPAGTPEFLPLIFALKDLRIRFHPSQFGTPAEFSKSACLVRGDQALTSGNEAQRRQWRASPLPAPLPEDPLAAMMLKELSQWPADALLAVRGIFAFGPGDVVLARNCALHALSLNPDCTLALQLLGLLEQKVDPRIPAKDVNTELRHLAGQMGVAATPTRGVSRPWWRFWKT